ncbi:MAG: hypothetical protein HY586_04595 [Candidatus Omnitrophica bacterium]|nr:hypothetical protein [Candidatus Omnitrophota bacterium]
MVAVSIFGFFSLKSAFESDAVKAKTEGRLSKLFKTHISVGRVEYKFFRRLSFSAVQFETNGYVAPQMAFAGVTKIVFGYSWRDVFKKEFFNPETIFFRNPDFQLEVPDVIGWLRKFPFSNLASQTKYTVVLENGSLSWPLAETGQTAGIQKIFGRIEKRSSQEVLIHLKGQFAGNVRGEISCEGTVNPLKKTWDLRVRCTHVEHTSGSARMLRNLTSVFQIRENRFSIEELTFFTASVAWSASGEVDDYFGEFPKFKFRIAESSRLTGGEFTLKLAGDFKQETLRGNLRGWGMDFPIRGGLFTDSAGYGIQNVALGSSVELEAFFLVRDGITRLRLRHGEEQYDIRFSLRSGDLLLDLNANHMQLYGFDISTRAYLRARPEPDSWNSGQLVFNTELSSDYLVFDNAPLDDFKGKAAMTREGFKNLTLTWGTGYKMSGEILFGNPSLVDVRIDALNIVLSETMRFGFHQLPEDLSGMMKGRVHVRGAADNPKIKGRLNIRSGGLKGLTFDKVILNFSGNRRFLQLKNSRIHKAPYTFYVKGGLDFTQPNIFSGIEIVSEDRLPIWRGKDVHSPLPPKDEPVSGGQEGDINRKGF